MHQIRTPLQGEPSKREVKLRWCSNLEPCSGFCPSCEAKSGTESLGSRLIAQCFCEHCRNKSLKIQKFSGFKLVTENLLSTVVMFLQALPYWGSPHERKVIRKYWNQVQQLLALSLPPTPLPPPGAKQSHSSVVPCFTGSPTGRAWGEGY